MWKRIPGYHRNRDPVISGPTLLDTTMDEKVLNSYQNVSDVNLGLPSPTPYMDTLGHESGDTVKGLPPLPFQAMEPMTSRSMQRPVSDMKTVSSVYSQPSPDLHQHQVRSSMAPTASSVYSEVSPPSSPEMDAHLRTHDWHGSPNISPVEELPETPSFEAMPKPQYTSHIPIPRRPVNSLSSTAPPGSYLAYRRGDNDLPQPRDSTLTNWNDVAGQERPSHGNTLYTHSNHASPQLPVTKADRSGLRQSAPLDFAEPNNVQQSPRSRIKGLGVKTNFSNEWQGVIGGNERASPNTDKPLPATKPIPIPARSPKRMSPAGGNSGESTPTRVSDARASETSYPATTQPPGDEEPEIKPIVPLKAGRNSPPRNVTPTTSAITSPTYGPPQPNMAPVAQYGIPSQEENETSRREAYALLTGTASQQRPNDLYTNFRNQMDTINMDEQPASRFSFTTYATGDTRNAYDDDPPSNPENYPPSPILNRKRPTTRDSVESSNVKATTRKPTPSQVPTIDAAYRDSKALPQPPSDGHEVDLITNLENQINNLHYRRGNLQRLIHDFSRGTYAQRGKVSEFEMELAEVQRQLHDLGMRLHRAWRRRDKLEHRGEPTGLWVRRVTG